MERVIFLVSFCLTLAFAANSNIVRPCALSDRRCIGDNLAANSQCNKRVVGSLPGQYTRNNFVFDTPFFNATYIENFVTIRNHDQCFVSEFFFNTETDSAVIGLDCPGLDFEANRTMVQHRPLQEDASYSYLTRARYPLIRFTTHLRNANALDLCSSYTSAYVFALPELFVNPNNKPTANFLSQDLSFLNIFERETFFYRANSLFRYFLNSYICDFGCNY